MLRLSHVVDYCMQKARVTQDFPFDEKTMVFRLCDKIFLATNVAGWNSEQGRINVKNSPDKNIFLREQYSAVVPGYHMNKKHWNTVNIFEEELSSDEIYQMIDESYDIIKAKLPKDKQKTLS